MHRFYLSLFVFVVSLLLVGCSEHQKISFTDTVDSVKEHELIVNCSVAVNKGKEEVDDIGYLCSVQIDSTTTLRDEQGNTLQLSDISNGDEVRVTLLKPVNLEESRSFPAKEVLVLRKALIE